MAACVARLLAAVNHHQTQLTDSDMDSNMLQVSQLHKLCTLQSIDYTRPHDAQYVIIHSHDTDSVKKFSSLRTGDRGCLEQTAAGVWPSNA